MKRTTYQANALKATMHAHRPPPPVNYLKVLREQNSYTLDALAHEIGITKQALIRLEQGTYERILPSVLEYYVHHFSDSELTLVDNYEAFQTLMRERNFHYFGSDIETDITSLVHPFRQLRERVLANPTEVAKALCVPQATIAYFERKIKHQKSVPKCLVNALHEVGYTSSQIESFKDSYDSHRKRVLGLNVHYLTSSSLISGSTNE